MSIDLKRLFRVCNPSLTLNIAEPEDKKYYIDFTSVRNANLVNELIRTIKLSDEHTCQLFTGHVGCGKTTELLRLKAELEKSNYHVVYFESSDDLDMSDVDITDILLVIARKITDSLAEVGLNISPSYFKKLFGGVKDFLTTDIELDKAEFSIGLAKISAKSRGSKKLRNKLRDYFESRTDSIVESINNEILLPAEKQLKDNGKAGLVVIVDNLDRIISRIVTASRTQPEYIFIDRGEQLIGLTCHLVYTIPQTLRFSNDAALLENKFGLSPKILGMIPVKSRNGKSYSKGIKLLKQMIMTRAYPDLPSNEAFKNVNEIFEDEKILNSFCIKSGGHVRNLLRMVFSCLQKQDPPITKEIYFEVLQEFKNELTIRVEEREWDLLRDVMKTQNVAGEREYHTLLRSMFVFEYRDDNGAWFGINPLLKDAEQLKGMK